MTLPYTLETARAPQIGLIVLQSDESLERDMARLLPLGAELLVSRVASATSVTPESLRAMDSLLTQAASLLPRGASLAAVGYGCTSATAQIGAGAISERIQAGVDTVHVTEPVSALIAACKHLQVQRLGLVSPYVASVSDRLREVLEDAGLVVCSFASFNEGIERDVVRISEGSIMDAAITMGQNSDCDAVFLSCTNLRTLDAIAKIEDVIGKPVLSSNQVLAWHLGQLTGCKMPPNGPGRLFD